VTAVPARFPDRQREIPDELLPQFLGQRPWIREGLAGDHVGDATVTAVERDGDWIRLVVDVDCDPPLLGAGEVKRIAALGMFTSPVKLLEVWPDPGRSAPPPLPTPPQQPQQRQRGQ
jgi:hypothetical protein